MKSAKKVGRRHDLETYHIFVNVLFRDALVSKKTLKMGENFLTEVNHVLSTHSVAKLGMSHNVQLFKRASVFPNWRYYWKTSAGEWKEK